MASGPKSAVFTTVRAKKAFVPSQPALERLSRHAEILGIEVPEIEIPNGLDGLVRIQQAKKVLNSIQFRFIKKYTWMLKE